MVGSAMLTIDASAKSRKAIVHSRASVCRPRRVASTDAVGGDAVVAAMGFGTSGLGGVEGWRGGVSHRRRRIRHPLDGPRREDVTDGGPAAGNGVRDAPRA